MRLIENETKQLKHKLLDMAELVQFQLDTVHQALTVVDHSLVKRIQKNEKRIDKIDNKIDRRCERVIALYQPVANDLRFIFSVLKINSNLEQIGDNVYSIARRVLTLEQPYDAQLLKELDFHEMAELTKHIVGESLLSYFENDAQRARKVFPQDDRIDDIYHTGYDKLMVRVSKDPANAAAYVNLIFIMKNLERIADSAVSNAEEAIFHLEGVTYRHSKYKEAFATVEQGEGTGLPGDGSFYQ